MRTLEHLDAAEAAAHRHGDARDLRPAGAPLRHGGHQGGTRGPRLQVPGAGGLPGPGRAGGRQAGGAGADDRPSSARPLEDELRAGRHRPRRGHGPPQAPLVDLPEDEAARQAVRRDLRPHGGARHREHGARVLPRPRHHPPQLDAAAGADQGLHREPQVQRLPVAAHHDLRARAASSSRCRSAPGRCTAPPSTASRRTGSTRRTASATTSSTGTSAGSASCSSCSRTRTRPEEFLEFLKVDLYQDEIFIFTPAGRREAAAQGRHRRSTSPSTCTPRSGCTARAPRSTAGSRRCTASSRTATRSRS